MVVKSKINNILMPQKDARVDRLKAFMEYKGWSQAELARRVGRKPQGITKYLSGEYDPLSLLDELTPEFDRNYDLIWFVTGDHPQEASNLTGDELDILRYLHEMGIRTKEQLASLLSPERFANEFAAFLRDKLASYKSRHKSK